MINYTQGLAYQLAGKQIRANSVSPGNTYFEGGVWNQIETGNPALFASALALNPTGRMATAQEIANGTVFLATFLDGLVAYAYDGAAFTLALESNSACRPGSLLLMCQGSPRRVDSRIRGSAGSDRPAGI